MKISVTHEDSRAKENGRKKKMASLVVLCIVVVLVCALGYDARKRSDKHNLILEKKVVDGVQSSAMGGVVGEPLVVGEDAITKLGVREAEPHHLGFVKSDVCWNNGYCYVYSYSRGFTGTFGIRTSSYYYTSWGGGYGQYKCQYLRMHWNGVNAAGHFFGWEKWNLLYSTSARNWIIKTNEGMFQKPYLRMNDHFVTNAPHHYDEEKFTIYAYISDSGYSWSGAANSGTQLDRTRGHTANNILIRGAVRYSAWLSISHFAAHGGPGASYLQIVPDTDSSGC